MDYKKRIYRYVIIKICIIGILVATALMQYIIGGWYSTTATLDDTRARLQQGVNPDESFDALGLTPLMDAANRNDRALAELLVSFGADVNAQAPYDILVTDNQGNTALHFATLNDNPEIVDFLLQHEADPLILNTFGNSPLHLVAYESDYDAQQKIFELLMRYGGNPNIQNSQGATLLHMLVELNSVQLLQTLFKEYGNLINVNQKNNSGLTQLELVRTLGKDDLPQLLASVQEKTLGLIADRDVNERDAQGYAGVNLAAFLGDADYMRQLIARNADVGARGPTRGNTPLYTAALFGFAPIVRLLIDHKAPVNVVNDEGKTIVMALLGIPSLNQREQFLSTVLNHGASLNAVDNKGNTMFHYAVLKHDTSWIRRLLEKFGSKLDLTIKNNKGQTVRDIAQQKNYADIVELLK